MGGGNYETLVMSVHPDGLSPRGRGKRGFAHANHHLYGSIPAWAGETRPSTKPVFFIAVYPRVGGGNGQRSQQEKQTAGLSPRGRGKPNRRFSAIA